MKYKKGNSNTVRNVYARPVAGSANVRVVSPSHANSVTICAQMLFSLLILIHLGKTRGKHLKIETLSIYMNLKFKKILQQVEVGTNQDNK